MATDPKGRLVFMNYKEKDLEETNNHLSSEPSQLLCFLTENLKDRVEIVTSGDQFQAHSHTIYRDALLCCGYNNCGSLHLTNESIYDHNVQERFASADVVLFVGDQSRLYSILKGTKILRILHKRYIQEENFTIAGVSTGGLCIPRRMISYFPANEVPKEQWT
jgi:cyanophycinase